MTRTLLALLLFILFGVAVTLFFEQDNGYVLIRYDDIVVESSLVFFTVALLFGLWLLSIAWRSLMLTLGLPRWLPALYQKYRDNAVQRSMQRGLLQLLEGRWAEAEKQLSRRSGADDVRRINFLGAAIAAQKQGAAERRDGYLQQAAGDGSPDTAVLLTQAGLQMQAGQYSQALASLELLREQQPDHRAAFSMLLQLCGKLEDWARLRELWPEAERLKLLDDDRRRALAEQAYADLLSNAALRGLDQLDAAWQAVPRGLKTNAAIRMHYLRQLLLDPAGHPEARRIISTTLKKEWQPEMALLFAALEPEDSVSQMSAVEGWIRQHGEQPELQLLAGQLCLRNKLWGRARSYLEAALRQQPDARAWQALGELNEQTGDIAGAASAYAEGLRLQLAPAAASSGQD